ncbi:hypothetical protein K458DRAFT_380342 [Lentithecium fluviatile CBS 122367]|uniref:Zn(2)-C6 fungal-type domain-containing protein n=1 Tax=Lentithecium fluviatile CBS 122367 TaxID=1168545 RepID=A0A6G1IE12_9PLEO|nr:hypothetical protein K458DRAFT_380342 [Lentithecium fluviatile CBS 122367]
MPKAQRSRACQQCRERRVKCDETAGFCQQCRRLGLACSGPLQGSVIIDMTDRVAKPRQRKKRELRTPVVEHENDRKSASTKARVRDPDGTESLPTPSTTPALQVAGPQPRKLSIDQWPERQADETIAAIRYQYKMPMLYQPSKAVPDALDRAFVSHFVQLMASVRMYRPEIPWITHLPNLQEKAIKPALKLSIRATSMAFYATLHKDPTILVDSYRWYILSLNSQRQSLARMGSHSMPAAEEILVPIILGIYEVYAGTTTTSMWHHLAAATKILELRGPSNCKGVAYPLFKAMRVSDAHRAMVFNTPSPFSTPEWMTVPFEGQISNAHQYLVDILLVIPDCIGMLEMGGSMRSFFARRIPPAIDTKPAEYRARQLLQQLDDWAKRCHHLTTVPTEPGGRIVSTDMETLATSGARESLPDGSKMVIPDSFIALTAATYEAIRLILTMLLMKLSPQATSSYTVCCTTSTIPAPGSIGHTLFNVAVLSCKSILEIAAYMESTHPVGLDFIRSVFPLVVAGILGPREEEKQAAQKMLSRWGKTRGMAGLCSAWLEA